MCVYLRTKFQVSSKILISFRERGRGEGEVIPSPTSKRTPKDSTQIRFKKIRKISSCPERKLVLKMAFENYSNKFFKRKTHLQPEPSLKRELKISPFTSPGNFVIFCAMKNSFDYWLAQHSCSQEIKEGILLFQKNVFEVLKKLRKMVHILINVINRKPK